jgi:uncharacterized protein YkwD
MKTSALLFALIALSALSGAAYALAATPTYRVYLPQVSCPNCTGPTTPPAPTPTPSSYAAQMTTLVNQARAAAGCPAVVANATLMRAAQDWTTTMANTGNYNHSGSTFYSGYGYTGGLFENINGGADTPEYAFDTWMASPTHRSNMTWCYPTTDPSYNPAMIYEIGVGYAYPGYWTLVIGFRIP